MIRHIVMWRMRGDTPEERLESSNLVKSKFENLKGQVPGLINIEVGINYSEVDYSCDAVLVTDFETHDALVHYGQHPAHLSVRDELLGVRIERFQVDYECSDPRSHGMAIQ